MATTHPNPPDVLIGEIFAEAKREGDEFIRRAHQEAEALLATATVEAEKMRRERLEAAHAEAARRSELMLATVPVEAGRLRSARIESILEIIREEARRRLVACDFDSHQSVVALAANAIRQMPGMDFGLKISATDRKAFGDKLAEEIKQRAGRSCLNLTISADPAMAGGGVMVQDAAGNQIWDNRLRSRLDRLWPELRRQIALQTSLVEKNEPAGGAT